MLAKHKSEILETHSTSQDESITLWWTLSLGSSWY